MSTHTHRVTHGVRTRRAIPAPGVTPGRLAALAGAVYCVLIIVFGSLTSGGPNATASSRDTFTWLTNHQSRLQLAAVLMGLAMPVALVFVSGLFRALRKAEGDTGSLAVAALGGGMLAAAGAVMTALALGTTATRVTEIGVSGARVWWTLYLMSFGAILLGLLLLIGATAVVSLRTRVFPRWLGVVSASLALVSIAGAITIGYPTLAIEAVAVAALIGDSIWFFLVSRFLWRDPTLTSP